MQTATTRIIDMRVERRVRIESIDNTTLVIFFLRVVAAVSLTNVLMREIR